jgi:hypothetical protein
LYFRDNVQVRRVRHFLKCDASNIAPDISIVQCDEIVPNVEMMTRIRWSCATWSLFSPNELPSQEIKRIKWLR